MRKMLFTLFLALVALVALVAAIPAAGQNLPPNLVWAEQFGQWSFASQAANTYTFPGSNCTFNPLSGGGPFFAFGNPAASLVYPVAIVDSNPANSEIVTPSSVSQASGACGFAAAPTNQHISFVVQSGTAGLQEAVGSLKNGGTPWNVMLDRYFYSQVAALPGAPSVATLIAALHGSGGVNIVDTTKSPWTFYTWSGSAYITTTTPAGLFSQSYTVTGATPGPVRTIIGNITTSNTSYANGTDSLAGVRGVVTIPNTTTASSGYLYGTQGKAILDGSTIAVGSAHVAGLYGQMSASGTTVNSGHVAIGILSGQNLPASNYIDGLYLESGTGPVNSIVKAIFNSNLVFDFSMQSGPGFAETTSGTGSGQCKQAGLVPSKAMPVKIDGTNYWIPLCTAL